jgi:hypothetical protein
MGNRLTPFPTCKGGVRKGEEIALKPLLTTTPYRGVGCGESCWAVSSEVRSLSRGVGRRAQSSRLNIQAQCKPPYPSGRPECL